MKILYAYNTSKFSDCYGFIGSEERVKRKGREREKEQEGKTREREGKIDLKTEQKMWCIPLKGMRQGFNI